MANYKSYNFGSLSSVDQYTFAPEGMPISVPGKLFLKEPLELTSVEVSVNKDKPGTGMSFFHRHKDNEEVYIFVKGKGEMVIDDERFEVKEGSVVKVNPEAKRSWWNTGDEDLLYIVIQGAQGSMPNTTIEDGVLMDGQVPWS